MTSDTRPCRFCGKKLPVEADFCMACGKPQDAAARTSDASNPFALVEDDEPAKPAPAAAPAPPPPPPPAPREDPEAIELADEPEAPPDAGDDAEDEDSEAGSQTVRMELSDVVQAWAEDAPASATPDVEAPRVPLTSNPKFVIIALLLAAVVAGTLLMIF